MGKPWKVTHVLHFGIYFASELPENQSTNKNKSTSRFLEPFEEIAKILWPVKEYVLEVIWNNFRLYKCFLHYNNWIKHIASRPQRGNSAQVFQIITLKFLITENVFFGTNSLPFHQPKYHWLHFHTKRSTSSVLESDNLSMVLLSHLKKKSRMPHTFINTIK